MNTSLSLCMIVKNEQVHMHHVLRNASLYADEIIIIDTGSTDRTKEIAKQYTQHVYDFPWSDDFSVARNFGISKCTKDFIISLDADDIILDEHAIKIKELLSQFPSTDIYLSPYHVKYHKNDKLVVYLFERIFRNTKDIFYEYPVYEGLAVCKDVIVTTIDIPVFHKNINRLDSKVQSLQRNLSILLPALQKKEYKENMKLWFQLANMYGALRQHDKSISTYYLALRKKEKNLSMPQKSRLHYELSLLLFYERENYREAQKHLEIAMKNCSCWREPIFEYAKLQFKQKKYRLAIQAFLQCKTVVLPKYQDVLNTEIYGSKKIDLWLARSYLCMGKIDSAIFYCLNAFIPIKAVY